MKDKDKKIKQAYNDILEAAAQPRETRWDVLQGEIAFLEILGRIYEAGRTEGLLANITEWRQRDYSN